MSLLLPKSKEDFTKSEYWDSFFRSRGSKAFEWYGEYQELSVYLHKYMKEKDKLLITGCGNSTIGISLYDVGYRDITNIDISQVVIKQMSRKTNGCAGLKYIQMDALVTEFDNDSFNVVLDKGTLDALMPNNDQETVERVILYFKEMERITKFSGRYICVSLLQEHILDIIMDYFPKNNWMVRIVRCFEAEQAAVENGEKLIPVFIVICTKFKILPKQILEVNLSSGEKMQRLDSVEQVKSSIMSSQQAAFICASLQQNSLASENEISLDLYEADKITPKYTVYVVDITPIRKNSPYAAFIVPQGRESEWLFSTKTGRKKLVSMSNHNRLLIVTMHRNQIYGSIKDVQNELVDIVQDLTPANVKTHKIPYLSLGAEGVGKRTIRYEGTSDISGGYIIEDVEMEEENYRRLFFLSNQLVIQSEAKLKSHKNRKGNVQQIVDLTYLSCKHHSYMILGAYVACGKRKDSSLAVLGLGGGGLCSILNKFIFNTKVFGVEIDPEVVKIATDWFGLQKNDRLHIHIIDGLKFLEDFGEQGKSLNAILFDVDNKDSTIGMSCPPREFLEDAALDNVKKIIGNEGFFILNVVLRDDSLRPSVVNKLLTRFKRVESYKIEEELNEIFICCDKDKLDLKTKLSEAVKELNNFFVKHNNKKCCVEINL